MGQALAVTTETGLAPLDEARQAIAQAREAQDGQSLRDWRDQAEAVQRYHSRRHAAREIADDAGEIRLRCEAALGQIDAEVAPAHRPKKDAPTRNLSAPEGEKEPEPAAGEVSESAPLADVNAHTRAAWRKLGKLNGNLDGLIDRLREDEDGGLTTTHAIQALKADALGVHTSSATPEWGTPQDLFDALNAEFHFDLDVCATPDLAKCERHFTPEQNGLTQRWAGVCWMNPPYGDAITHWMEKAHHEGDNGNTVVCLVPARVDTGWWWDHTRYGEVRFLRGAPTSLVCDLSHAS